LWILKRFCSRRAIVVSRQLAHAMKLDDVCVVNGVCADVVSHDRAFGSPVQFLYGGSIESATGLDLFTATVRKFANEYRELASQVRFVVTGFGGTVQLGALAREVVDAGVRVDVMQDRMLAEADVGLSLKMPGSNLVATTFPSKVVELASHGLLVLTTDVSDVGVLFNDDTAVVLRDATPGELASKIAGIARDPARYRRIAQAGQRAINTRCGRQQVGAQLVEFLQAGIGGQAKTAVLAVAPVSVGEHVAKGTRRNPVTGALGSLRFPLANAVLGMLPATRMFGPKRFLLRLLGFELAPGCRIAGGVKFYGKGRVTIGADTWVGLGCTFVVAPDAPVTIGARCDIAPQTIFHTGSHEIGDAARRAGAGYSRPIVVGDGSWVGTRCTLLAGATIGAGSIVAAATTVIPGSYEANVLLAGSPAVVKRKLQ
jgi:acetyltransferase-like isoleucine patch superfamily enzyme